MSKKPSKTFREWCIENKRENLLEEWDYEKNSELGYTPDNVSYGSAKDIWWRCEENHTFTQSIRNRTLHTQGCPYCSNRKILKGYNDLETYCKNNNLEYLMKEWDYKNNTFKPDEIFPFSHKDIYWVCSKGHRWTAHLDSRVNKNCSCPYCTGRLPVKGINDLETYCKNNGLKHLLEEWDYIKNKRSPNEFKPFSNKKVHWKCRFCSNEWETNIGNRTFRGDGCKKCNTHSTSFPEQAILYYIKQYYPDVINRYTDLGFELDIYIPSLKIGIEYDGNHFHQNKKDLETKKNKLCKDNDITLIRIREQGLCSYNDCVCLFRKDTNTKQGLDIVLMSLFNHLQIHTVNIDTQKDTIAIMENYRLLELENSLTMKFPEIAKEWHPTLNGKLKPENFSCGSGLKVWWKCSKCSHEFEMIIGNRTRLGIGCPNCTRPQKFIKNDNDLETWCKQNNKEYILEEFDCDKNFPLTPKTITFGSCKKIWWKCNKCGYKWKIAPNRRTFADCGCRLCSHTKPVRCIETGKVFNSIKLAAEYCNLKKGDKISMCCKGTRKTAGGYHWEYVDDKKEKENI